ncbi:MAG: 2Fe-2S iron-sulfur cluster binding domain-containing protein [Alphaproteobacteria bacterium]|nr:2Fe-2S iron-sulfur cluster binding domain-containing protein [Alphaproteobacteria bacterium]
MITIIFKYNNEEFKVNATEGETLLECALKNNVPLIGGCGGSGICGSCNVEIDPEYINKIPEPDVNEQDVIEYLPMYKPTTRLACQIKITNDMDGMIVNINN